MSGQGVAPLGGHKPGPWEFVDSQIQYEVLEALEHVMSWFPLERNTNLLLDEAAADRFERDKDIARAAIAKARGEQ